MNDSGAINYSTKYVPTIRALMESNAMIRIVLGPWGSGKSVGCMMELIRRSQLQTPNPQGIRKTRWAIVRNTYRELQDTTQKTFFEWLQHGIHGEYQAAKKTFVFGVPPGDGTRVHSDSSRLVSSGAKTRAVRSWARRLQMSSSHRAAGGTNRPYR